MDVIVKS